MNYSRYLYLITLLEYLIKKCAESHQHWSIWMHLAQWLRILLHKPSNEDKYLSISLISVNNQIRAKVQEIYSQQEGGYWPVTKGDTVFIEYMNMTCTAIEYSLLKVPITRQKCQQLINQLKLIVALVDAHHNPKIKALIMVQEMTVWPSIESVYEAFLNDPNCEVQLVYIPFEHVNKDKSRNEIEEYRDRHLPIVHCKDYDLSEESPDLAFFVKPYDCIPIQFYIDNVDKVVTRSIYIPYFSNCLSYNNIDFHLDYHFRLPMHEKVWKIFDGPDYVRDFYKIYSLLKGENVEPFGHPRMDYLEKIDAFRMDIPKPWKEKIGNKKVFLWNTSRPFGSKGENEHGGATFEVFGQDLLNYFKQHEEIALLWRPHPFFFNGVIINKLMTDIEVDELKLSIMKSKNIILDSNPDYRYAFSVADGLVSDSSSLLLDFLLLDKPIVYTCHEESYSMVNSSLLPAFQKATTWKDVEKFIKMIINGEDQLKYERRSVIDSIAPSQEKKVGEMVKDTCIKDLEIEEKSLAIKDLMSN